jgi:hypothetical protein
MKEMKYTCYGMLLTLAEVVTQINDMEALKVVGIVNLKPTKEEVFADGDKRPCKHCGSKKHSLLLIDTTTEGELTRMEKDCPMITDFSTKVIVPGEEIAYSYIFDAESIARSARYRTAVVENTIEKMATKGVGRELTSEQLLKLRTRALEKCVEQITNPKNARFVQTHLSPSCLCCGSPDHALLRSCQKGCEYVCPLRRELKWNPKQNRKATQYRISPSKLARQYDYNMTRIEEAFQQYKRKGAGRWSTSHQLHSLWEDLLVLTMRYQAMANRINQTRSERTTEQEPDAALIQPKVREEEKAEQSLQASKGYQMTQEVHSILLTFLSFVWVYLIGRSKLKNTTDDL